MLAEAIERSRGDGAVIGAGLPHASQVEPEVVVEIAARAAAAGAARLILYDTNGSAEPFEVAALVTAVRDAVTVPIYFHGHNDLGLAVANAWAAVRAGAAGADVTLTGLGDRAGNASLEQLAMLLHLRGIETGLDVSRLPAACRLVEEVSGVAVSKLAPVVGEYAFDHRSPAHLDVPTEFEAFDPTLVGSARCKGES
jgi:homocitrate synthase NifV